MTREQDRQDTFRVTSKLRDHVTTLPGVVVAVKKTTSGELVVGKIHRAKRLWVYPRKYVNTKLSSSKLDPTNYDLEHRATNMAYKLKVSPQGIPAPKAVPRWVTASKSGNVNSQIIYNYFKDEIIPLLKKLGFCKPGKWVLLNWDRHSTHESVALFELLRDNYIRCSFYPGHATDRLQLQDLKEFQVLKTDSTKCIALWTAFLIQRNTQPEIVDFPFILQRAIELSSTQKIVKEGLKMASLFPFTPDKKLSKMAGAKTYKQYKKQFATEDAAAKQSAKIRNLKPKDKPDAFADMQSFDDGVPLASESEERGSEPDLWSQNQSAPERLQTDNHGVRRRLRKRTSDPTKASWSIRPGLNEHGAHLRKNMFEGLALQDSLKPEAVFKKGARGTRIGKPGDLFTDEQVTAARDVLAKEKKKKKTRKKPQQEVVSKLRSQLKASKTQIKDLKKKMKQTKSKNPPRKRTYGKQTVGETSSDEEPESELEEEDESDDEQSPSSSPSVVVFGSKRKRTAIRSVVSEDDKADDSSFFSSDGEDISASKLGEPVAPPPWYITAAPPSKKDCTFSALKGKSVLFRYEPADKKEPRGWFRGLVRGKSPTGREAKNFNVNLGFTPAGCNSSVTKPFDVAALLEPANYGAGRKWVFITKKRPGAQPPPKKRRTGAPSKK